MMVYNKALQKYVVINEGEELCPECNGKGQIPCINHETKTIKNILRCHNCQGKGKLDWIEKVVGVKPVVNFDMWMDKAAEELAKSVDRQILKSLNGEYKNVRNIRYR